MHPPFALIAVLALASPAVAQVEVPKPTPVFDHAAPDLPSKMQRPAFLVLTKANGYRHENMASASHALAGVAAPHHWTIYDTDNAAVFNPRALKRFDVVVLNNTSGDLFTPGQRDAFKTWIESGGRVVVLHGAGATSPSPWPWFSDAVIGARFIGHPKVQPATVHIEDTTSPIVAALPHAWAHTDEWYSFDRNPRGAGTHVLATVDEQTYTPTPQFTMGADHPIIWTRCVMEGGAFFTALGHQPEQWRDPLFLTHIDAGMAWALDHTHKAC